MNSKEDEMGYRVYDSDAHGVNTDSPETPYEIIKDSLARSAIDRAIQDGYRDWLKETAREYFDTGCWSDEWWDSFEEYVREVV